MISIQNIIILISILSVTAYEKHYYNNCPQSNGSWEKCPYPNYLCNNDIPIFINASSNITTYCDYMEHVELRIFSPYGNSFENIVTFLETTVPIESANSTDVTVHIGKSLCIDTRCSVEIFLKNHNNYPIELHQYVKQKGFWINVWAIIYDYTPPALFMLFVLGLIMVILFCFLCCWVPPKKKNIINETTPLASV